MPSTCLRLCWGSANSALVPKQVAGWPVFQQCWPQVSPFGAGGSREGGETDQGSGGAGRDGVGPDSGFHHWILSVAVVQVAQLGSAQFTASLELSSPTIGSRAIPGEKGRMSPSSGEIAAAA